VINRRSTIDYYEAEDGNKVVLEFYDRKENLEQIITMERHVAIELSKGILELLGDY
jgi:hypothetical protein|tara:strand:- start:2293 stop:2460 length:168 start_codon:yes stop_codon:yes gene_type:complete